MLWNRNQHSTAHGQILFFWYGLQVKNAFYILSDWQKVKRTLFHEHEHYVKFKFQCS